MPEAIEIRIEKFLSLKGIFFAIPLLVMGGFVTLFQNNYLLAAACFIGIAGFIWLYHLHSNFRKNPIILIISDQGVTMPHRRYEKFITWKNFLEIREDVAYGAFSGLSTKIVTLVLYFCNKNGERKKYFIPYTVGKGQPLNYSKEKIVAMIEKASKRDHIAA